MTCYDLRFPELARRLVDAGAEVIVVPAAWLPGDRKVEHWRTLLAARAIENTCFVVGAAQPEPRYCGHSAVFGPMGEWLGEAAGGEETLEVTLDRADLLRPVVPTRPWPTAGCNLLRRVFPHPPTAPAGPPRQAGRRAAAVAAAPVPRGAESRMRPPHGAVDARRRPTAPAAPLEAAPAVEPVDAPPDRGPTVRDVAAGLLVRGPRCSAPPRSGGRRVAGSSSDEPTLERLRRSRRAGSTAPAPSRWRPPSPGCSRPAPPGAR